MKYVILIHSNPDPWGHPTSHHTAEGRALPQEQAIALALADEGHGENTARAQPA